MTRSERIVALSKLGRQLTPENELLAAHVHRSSVHNPWFTTENQWTMLRSIASEYLEAGKLANWLANYPVSTLAHRPRKIGIVMAGNLPLVGFHDWLCVFASGNQAQVKLSEKDPFLFPYIVSLLEKIAPRTARSTVFVEKLQDFDAVIATGSNNTARYFEEYFGRFPHIIRRNRNSVAILTGSESDAEITALGHDIFQYFGLGCRNVSKVIVPEGYNPEHLLEVLHSYREIILHEKYKHNFDYNFALYSINRVPFKINGCLILVENPSLKSRIGVLHYAHYKNQSELAAELQEQQEQIQCIVGQSGVVQLPVIPFGKSQSPALTDYADHVDTMQFLLGI
jgi:hypothetical protein